MRLLAVQLMTFCLVLSVWDFQETGTPPMAFMHESLGKWHSVVVPSDILESNASSANPHNRGVVVVIHQENFAAALSLVRELACLGADLPVELHHCGAPEFPPDLAVALKHPALAHARLVDACELATARGLPHPGLYSKAARAWLMPLAVLVSEFDHVMVLDAHALVLRDPTPMWTHPGYETTGSFFFRQRDLVPADLSKSRFTHLLRKYSDLYVRDRSILASSLGLSANFSAALNGSSQSLRLVDPAFFLMHKTRHGDRLPARLKQLLMHVRTDSAFDWRSSHSRRGGAQRVLVTPPDCVFFLFELLHQPTHLAALGASTLDAARDVQLHPTVFCGPVAQYLLGNASQDLLYVHGATLLDPQPKGFSEQHYSYMGYNDVPSYVTTPRPPQPIKQLPEFPTCDAGVQQFEPLSASFYMALARRRAHYHALALGTYHGLATCS
nr:secreted protein [Achlya hypogyna]